MEFDALLARLSEAGVELFIQGGELRARAPKGSLDPGLQQALTAHREQLRAVVGRRQQPADPASAFLPRDRGAVIPLSFGQQRLWFLDQLGSHAAYNMPAVLRVHGAFDAELVQRSLNALVARHEALRTAFPAPGGRPQQAVAGRLSIPVGQADLSGLGQAAQTTAMADLVQREISHRFDLATGPLLRATVAKLGPADHAVVLNLHHIVADAWSMRIFIREMASCYQSFAEGRPVDLPPLPVQYPDYAIGQRAQLTDERLGADLAYWRAELDGAPDLLDLPADRPHPAQMRYRGAVVHSRVPADLRDRLAAHAAARDATLFQLLLAAYATLLHRYSGQADLVVGVPLAGRGRPEIAPLIGFFVDTLPVRVRFSGDPSFDALTGQVRSTMLAGLEHLAAPFERIVDAISPERGLHHAPLFQTMFSVQEAPTSALEVDALGIEILPCHNGTAKFDLTVLAEERPDGIDVPWEFNSDVLDPPTVARFAENYLVLLESICADPTRPVSRLPLLAEAERRAVVLDWNATRADYPAGSLVDALFRTQAERTPGADAVRSGGTVLSYADLDRWSDAVAAALHTAGVRRGHNVGVCSGTGPDRGLDLVVGQLGIAKAGGCHVPLAASDPADRLAFMIADAGLRIVVAPADLHSTLHRAAPGLTLLAPAATTTAPRRPPAAGARDPEDPLYLMYTSGSTGRPKGVVVPHRGVTRLVCNQNYLAFEAGETFAQWSNPTFDVATFEVWGALLHGGCLVCEPPAVLLDPPALARQVRSTGVRVGFLTASLFNQVANVDPAAFATMDTLLVGGEALEPRWVREVLRHGPPRRLLNGYGPTEATSFAAWHEITSVGEDQRSIPIGRPIANTTLYVLDRWGEPVPIGVRGELCIGGPGVALRYHDRPGLTAERFRPDPFADGGGQLYRTGDEASLGPDGTVHFHGRTDGQVKIRGHRVELGEIEHALSRVPGVDRCAVAAHRLPAGHQQLVAYLVPAAAAAPVQDLRDRLSATLPEYMVPAVWIGLDGLPATPSGKLDRAALPLPPRAAEPATATAELRGGTEAVLAEVWREVLGVAEVRREDNFFRLGGDSILSMQVVAGAERRGVQVSARQVFGTPNLAALAAAAGTERIDAEQGLVSGDVPLTPIQRWFFGLGLAEPGHFTQSLLLLLDAATDAGALAAALAGLPAQHDALRLRFRISPGELPVQSHAEAGGAATLDVLDLAGLPAPDQEAAIATHGAALKRSLDLEHGPLLRGALFRTGPDTPARLLLAAHHLVVDGVSWRILVADLFAAYAEHVRGLPPRPPGKTTSYRAWAEQLLPSAGSAEVLGELPYWLSIGAGPADRDVARAPAAEAVAEFGAGETARLLSVPQDAYGMGAHEVLAAALVSTLAAGSGSVLADLEAHGRDARFDGVDLTRTVGWFTSLYPVRFDVDPDADARSGLLAVKERLRGVPGGGVGWGLLRYCAGPDIAERLAALPRPRVGYNYLGRLDSAAAGGPVLGLAAEPAGPDWASDAAVLHPLEVVAQVVDGRLTVRFTGTAADFGQAAVERIAAEVAARVRGYLDHLEDPAAGGYSPSDFPGAGLGQDDLDALVAQLADAGLDV